MPVATTAVTSMPIGDATEYFSTLSLTGRRGEIADKLSEDAFDDQCTGANPRYPLISELKQILMDTFYGREFSESLEVEAVKAPAAKAEKKSKK